VRICMLTSSYPRFRGDNPGSFVQSLSEALVRRGHEVHVVAPYDPLVQPDPEAAVVMHRFRYVWSDDLCLVGHARSLEADVRLKRSVYPLTILYLAAALKEILRLNRRHRFDVIHANWLLPNGPIGAAAHRITGVPLLIHLHGSDVFVSQRNRVFGSVARWALRSADQVIACGADLLRRARVVAFDLTLGQVLPYGVDLGTYAPLSGGEPELRRKLGIEITELVVLALGRLVYKKGFDTLIQAIPQVVERCPRARFVIAGGGDLYSSLSGLARRLGVTDYLVMTGSIPWDETPRYFSMADVLAVPSMVDSAGNVDGLPNVLLEGMAAGLPVIASRVAGIPAVVEDQVNGLLTPPGDVTALVTALSQLLDDPGARRRYGRAARAKMVREMSWDRVAQEVEEVYESIAQCCANSRS